MKTSTSSAARALSVLALAILASCTDQPTGVSTSHSVAPLSAAAAGKVDTNSRANYVWADEVVVDGIITPAGIQGDGRLKDGSLAIGTPSNEYQAAYCGVAAAIEYGELNFDPDANYSSSMQAICGAARAYRFYLSGPAGLATAAGSQSIARGLDTLRVGQSVTQWEGFASPVAGCAKLVFDDQFPPASSPRQTRLADVGTTSSGKPIRQWRVESQGSHRAACVNYKPNGTAIYTGVTYLLPFALTITEVPYPFQRYP